MLRWAPPRDASVDFHPRVVVVEGEPVAPAPAPQASNALSELAPLDVMSQRTPVVGPVATAFCDALRTWILGQGVTEYSSGHLRSFFDTHPQFKDICFEGHIKPGQQRAGSKGAASKGVKFAVEASPSLRWVKGDRGQTGRIAVIGGEPAVAPAPAPQASTPAAAAPCRGRLAMAPSPRPSATRYDSGSSPRTDGGRHNRPHPVLRRPRRVPGRPLLRRGRRLEEARETGQSRCRGLVGPTLGPGRPGQRAHRGRRRRASRSSHRGRRRGRPRPRRGPRRAPCDGPVAAAFCDALRQYILSQNLTAVASNDLTQFYEAYPQFKTARFCEEGGDPAKGGHKRRLKLVVDASSVLRWVPVGQGIGESQDGVGRIEVVGEAAPAAAASTTPAATTTPAAPPPPPAAHAGAPAYQSQTHLLAALHAWIVGRNLRDIGVGDLSQFYQAHPQFGLKNWPGGGVRKALDGCPNLRWIEGDGNMPGTVSTARIAVVDTWGRLTVQNEAPPLAPGEVRVYDSTPTAQTFFDALRQWMRAKNVSSLDVSGDLSQFYDFHPHLTRCYSESR